MIKMTNKDLLVTISIGLLATVILVIVFQNSFGGTRDKEETAEVKKVDNTEQTASSTSDKVELLTFNDNNLGITFKYPPDLRIVTNGIVPTEELMWLEVSSISTSDAKKEKYWQENLGKLAKGELVVLPGDIFIKDAALQALAGFVPVSIYTEVGSKNCQAVYNNKLVALIDNKIVTLSLRQNPAQVTSELKEFEATTTEAVVCKDKNLESYNTKALIESVKNGKANENILSNMQYFRNILATVEITKIKPDSDFASTTVSALIKTPTVDKSGNLNIDIDKVVYLEGDEAKAQMKKDGVCSNDCVVPTGGYLVNQTKKYLPYLLDYNPYIVLNLSATSTVPAKATRVSLPELFDYLKQKNNDLKPVFDVFFDDKEEVITGLKQRS